MNHILSRNKRRVLGLLAMRRRLFKEEAAGTPLWSYTAVSPASPGGYLINLQDRADLTSYSYVYDNSTGSLYTYSVSGGTSVLTSWNVYYWWTGGWVATTGSVYLTEVPHSTGPDSLGNYYDDFNTTSSAGEIIGKD